jgi:hypothetical protein
LRTGALFLAAAVALASPSGLPAEEKDPKAEPPPVVLFSQPPAVVPGGPARLVIRGLRLETATEVRFGAPPGLKAAFGVPVLEKTKVQLGAQEKPERLGDSQITVEVRVPQDLGLTSLAFVAVSPAGESRPQTLLLDREALPAEKEPNGGFRTAQEIPLGETIAGSFGKPEDVDLFRFDARAGERVRFEVIAATLGGPADPLLVLYDAAGEEILSRDDDGGSRDPILEATLTTGGSYYLAVLDAGDQGGPAYFYRLITTRIPSFNFQLSTFNSP